MSATLLQFNDKVLFYNDKYLGTNKAPTYPTEDLWAIWRFNDNVNDSYSDNNLTNNPASYETGSIPSSFEKSAASFSGSVPTINDNVFMPVGAALSLSFWIYPKTAGPSGRICGTAGNSYGRCGISIGIGATEISWGKESSGWFGPAGLTSFTARDQWAHLVMTTGDGNTYKFYINGTKGTDVSHTENLNYGIFNIGNLTTGTGYLTNVKMASMFVYTKELSTEEIGLLYNNGGGV